MKGGAQRIRSAAWGAEGFPQEKAGAVKNRRARKQEPDGETASREHPEGEEKSPKVKKQKKTPDFGQNYRLTGNN